MKIDHELTADDLANCNAMMLSASPPAKNRPVAIAAAAFGVGGALLLWKIFSLSTWALIALFFYAVILVWIIVFALQLAAKGQISKIRQATSMKREYFVSESGLEIRMPDLTQTFPAHGIVRLESRERGTLVHLSQSTPTFLPFGSAFRSDFVDALQAVIKKRK